LLQILQSTPPRQFFKNNKRRKNKEFGAVISWWLQQLLETDFASTHLSINDFEKLVTFLAFLQILCN
jgi:hypothetical protein